MKLDADYNYFGNKEILQNNTNFLGVVGSRSITPYTKSVLNNLFSGLAGLDITIVSGGMYGVDIYSHNLALTNNLKTIVVLPCGINCYTSSKLYKELKIKDYDRVVFYSKYPSNQESRKYTFLERNKIIANLSTSVLIAQAGMKSGTMYTASYCLRISKKLFAIPSGLDQVQFQGTNHLISKGANIYLGPKSIIDLYGLEKDTKFEDISFIDKINGFTFNEILQITNLNQNTIQKNLLKLILEGKIFQVEGRYFKC